jgi:hypothetical protein
MLITWAIITIINHWGCESPKNHVAKRITPREFDHLAHSRIGSTAMKMARWFLGSRDSKSPCGPLIPWLIVDGMGNYATWVIGTYWNIII